MDLKDGDSELTRAGLFLFLILRTKVTQGVERLQRLAAWRRPLQPGCCAPLPDLSGQPAAADGRRDETYCSYLEHAQPGGRIHKTQEKQRQAKLEHTC